MTHKNFSVAIFDAKKKCQLDLLIGIWLLTSLYFYWWWFQPAHVVDIWRMTLNSLIIAYTTIIPAYFFHFLRRAKKPDPSLPIDPKWRIAMIVTRAPSEPIEVVQRVLIGMLKQAIPHDTWLADEDPSIETESWCKDNGVKLITRRGVAEYHQKTWPRRTKCKEGNLAYFYDSYGYADYDFVIQMDSDHVPAKGYLEAILPPFNDPGVGYVTAPSICDYNAKDSWVTRGRLYLEGALHGTQQAGSNEGWAPMCIGSHFALRTTALKAIGGLGPELAEDHSTTLLFIAGGWKGVHAIDAIANGNGPISFTDGIIQEFQWARSLVSIFLTLTPKLLSKLSPKLQFQFLFCQLWYFLFSYTMLIGFLLPPTALLFGKAWVHLSYLDYLGHAVWPALACIGTILWVKQQNLLRPTYSKVMSWEGLAFALARWPWMVYAVLDAFNQVYRGRRLIWNVTPKSRSGAQKIQAKILLPYLILLGFSLAALVTHAPTTETIGYYFFTIFNIVSYLFLLIVIFYKNYSENPQGESSRSRASLPIRLPRLITAFQFHFASKESLQ